MKGLNKANIERRLSKCIFKPKIEHKPILNTLPEYKPYSHNLHILIPGLPIADSRPRHNTNTGAVYNGHKTLLMKIFSTIYEGSILEDVCVMGPLRIELRIYKPLPKKYKKLISKKDNKLMEKENLLDTFKQDNDNFEKIHWDVLQDVKYMIILQDEMITTNITRKYSVSDEKYARVEIDIFYNEKIEKWTWDRIRTSSEYFKYLIHPKYLKRYNKSEWKKMFYMTVLEYWKETKSKAIVKRVSQMLNKAYSTEQLYLIGEGRNKEQVINNILKTVEKITIG